MTTRRWVFVGSAVIVLGLAAWYLVVRQSEPPLVADLVQQFPQAVQKSNLPLDRAFAVTNVTINGETKPAILARSSSRITWHIRPPADAWFTAYIALDPRAWALEGDGVQFRVGVSVDRSYDEPLKLLVDPRHVEGDRRWIPIAVDLSPYADRQVELILNTDAGLDRNSTPDNDESLWGAPKIRIGR